MRSLNLLLVLILSGLAYLMLVWIAIQPTATAFTIHHVAPNADCGTATPCYATLQSAHRCGAARRRDPGGAGRLHRRDSGGLRFDRSAPDDHPDDVHRQEPDRARRLHRHRLDDGAAHHLSHHHRFARTRARRLYLHPKLGHGHHRDAGRALHHPRLRAGQRRRSLRALGGASPSVGVTSTATPAVRLPAASTSAGMR